MSHEALGKALGLWHCLRAKVVYTGLIGFISQSLPEGFPDAFSHGIIKGVNGLAAKHVILVGLDGNAGQGRVGRNVVGLAQHAVTSGKSALEQLDDIIAKSEQAED